MSSTISKTLDYFPFYKVDQTSWQLIANQPLQDVWPQLEEHINRSIVTDDIELLQLICLDSKNRVINSEIIAIGTINCVHAKIRYVAEKALKSKVFGIILAHNHTSGNTTPSWDDVTYTKTLHHAFNLLNIFLVDHLVVGPDSIFSMRRNCLIF